MVLAIACLVSFLPVSAAEDVKLYVNVDYSSATEGWGTTRFATYSSALNYAKTNAKKATIVVEKTNGMQQIDQNTHKNLTQLGVEICDGAIIGNSHSKWDMGYPLTIKPGGKLQSARGNSSNVGNTHVKNTLIVGEAGSTKKAVIDFQNKTTGYKDMSIAILSGLNRKLIANNAIIRVGDLGINSSSSFTDSIVDCAGIVAFKSTSSITRTVVTVKGHDLMHENTYYSTTGTILKNLTMDASSVSVDDGVDGTVAETVTANGLTMKNGSSVTVEPGTVFSVSGKLTIDRSSTLDVGEITFGTSGKIVLDTTGMQVGAEDEVIIKTESAKPADFLDKCDVITEEGTAVQLRFDSTNDDKIILRKVLCFDVVLDAAGNAAPAVNGAGYKIPSMPTKKGYEFLGWYTDETCTVEQNTTDVNFDVVYAKWMVAALTGTARVSSSSTESGNTLKITVSSHNNTGDFTYQWYRYTNGDGQPIEGATAQSYIVTDADAECVLFALVGSTVQTGTLQSTASQVAPLQDFADGSITVQSYNGTYDGDAHGVSVTAPDGASVKYSTDGVNFAETAPTFTDAGSYTVYYSVTQPKYSPYNGSFTVTIEPKEVSLTWSTISGQLIYNGKAYTMTAKVDGMVAGDACTVEVEPVGSNVNAGNFCYRAVSLSNANYKLPANADSPSYTIIPREITVSMLDCEINVGEWPEYTYVVEGLLDGDELIAEPGFGTSADFKKPGVYYVYPSGADAGPNYTINYAEGKLTVIDPVPTKTSYTVKVSNTVNGSVSVSTETPFEGDNVTVTVVPMSGYILGTLTVNANGAAVALTKVSDTVYSFKMPAANAVVAATFAKADLSAEDCYGGMECPAADYIDLEDTMWYHDGVHYCVENGLMVGVSADRFAPEAAMTRAALVSVLWCMEGEPKVDHELTFKDVSDGEWYSEAIAWANSVGIVTGYNNRKFGPEDEITREQIAAILYRYADYKGELGSVAEDAAKNFSDWKRVGKWAETAVAWACDQGLIAGIAEGNNLTVAPRDTATRAQTANIIYRYIENI